MILKDGLVALYSFLLSLFWVVFLWGFFQNGLNSLGLNASLFLFGVFSLFLFYAKDKGVSLKDNLFWTIPIALIILSLFLYNNPFFKFISLFFVLPWFFAFFYNLSFLSNRKEVYFSDKLISIIFLRTFSFLNKLSVAVQLYKKQIKSKSGKKKDVFFKIFLGVFLLALVLFSFIIPLLSSADPVFSEKVSFFYSYFKEFFSSDIFFKALVLFVIAVFIPAFLFSWSDYFELEKGKREGKTDPIVAGIFIGGVSLVYFLFLWIQARYLFVGQLPFDFSEVTKLVKSGFWQLFFLSVFNVLIYFFTYKKTGLFVQRLLFVFTFSSLLLLFSAGQRMFLYVYYYGLSYEKLVAFYTVIFSAILFFYLLFNFFSSKKKDILKFVLVLFLWMYSILTILPTEKIILKTNIFLKENVQNSNIKIGELRMLSSDILYAVKNIKEKEFFKKEKRYIDGFDVYSNEAIYWKDWIKLKEKGIISKKWYEKTFSDWVYLAKSK